MKFFHNVSKLRIYKKLSQHLLILREKKIALVKD